MSRPKDSHKSSLPHWQSTKMRMIIRERWEEIWEVVETRDKYRSDLHRYLESWRQIFDY
jgi:hypothetical protein